MCCTHINENATGIESRCEFTNAARVWRTQKITNPNLEMLCDPGEGCCAASTPRGGGHTASTVR